MSLDQSDSPNGQDSILKWESLPAWQNRFTVEPVHILEGEQALEPHDVK